MIGIDSKRPMIFIQERVGRNGKKFKMYKFKTMYVSTNPYEQKPNNGNDPKITPIGRILRKTSLDELPQFLNVLKGDMSLVGPRPEMEFIVNDYNEIHRERLKLRPGITGLWQISASRDKPIHENIEYDLYYISNHSILLDFVILIKTLFRVLQGAGR